MPAVSYYKGSFFNAQTAKDSLNTGFDVKNIFQELSLYVKSPKIKAPEKFPKNLSNSPKVPEENMTFYLI